MLKHLRKKHTHHNKHHKHKKHFSKKWGLIILAVLLLGLAVAIPQLSNNQSLFSGAWFKRDGGLISTQQYRFKSCINGKKGICLDVKNAYDNNYCHFKRYSPREGNFDSGNYCAGPWNIQCCVPVPKKNERIVDPDDKYRGSDCRGNMKPFGTCLHTVKDEYKCRVERKGTFDPGLPEGWCPGSNNIQCCVNSSVSGNNCTLGPYKGECVTKTACSNSGGFAFKVNGCGSPSNPKTCCAPSINGECYGLINGKEISGICRGTGTCTQGRTSTDSVRGVCKNRFSEQYSKCCVKL